MSTIDLVIIIAYFAIMAALGVYSFFKHTSSEDYFVAGKSLGTFSLAAMWMASWIGGASIVGTATNAYDYGVSGAWYTIGLALGCVIFGLTMAKPAKHFGDKMQNMTYGGLIKSRYDRRSGDMVVIIAFVAWLGTLASQLVAMGTMLHTITSWSLFTCFIVSTVITVVYSAIGGLMAITYTTWVQFILIIVGTVILGIPLTIKAMGSMDALRTLPSEMFDWGNYGWSTIIALAVSSILSFYVSMDSYTRCFAAKNEKVSRNGALWAGFSVIFISFGATLMGMGAKVLIPDLPEGTSAYAALVSEFFPTGISGLIFVGVFAAIMSTGVVCINMCAANISVDLYKERLKPDASDRSVRFLGMISSLVVGVLGAAMAWWRQDIIDLLLMAFTFQSASLFFPTVFGLFWRKPTGRSSFYAMITSLIVTTIFVIGNRVGWGGPFKLDGVYWGLLTCFIVFMVSVKVIKPTQEELEHTAAFFD